MNSHWKRGNVKLEEEENAKGIPTLCKSLDALLTHGNGIKPGTLTEVVGLPGVGKTTFCLQLCLNVQIPEVLKGYNGQAFYLGTDHSFSKFRLSQIATEFVNRSNLILHKHPAKNKELLTFEGVMSKIHVARCCDLDELIKIIMNLGAFIELNPDIKLVVIDSISYPMLTESEQFSKRVKVLYNIAQLLLPLMYKYGVAVVVTNNMTTRFSMENGIEQQHFVPFLGESWSHIPNQILTFKYNPEDKYRTAELTKSSFCSTGTAKYRIIHDGFRD